MVLNKLDRSAAAQIVAQLSHETMPQSLIQLVVEHADGVPLFLEELTKAMLEAGAGTDISLPATLHDSLMERLDRLPMAKRVAQLGAAIGRSFSHELIAMLSDAPEKELSFTLNQLVSSTLIARHGLTPDATYTFKHALVQAAAYESMLKSQRTAIHKRIVELLLLQEQGIEDSQPDLLAYHCEFAGLTEKAAVYYTRAGWRSNYRGAYEDSREQFRNALRLAGALPEGTTRDLTELRALRGIGLTTGTIEGWSSANYGAANLRALELCERVGNPPESLGINFGVSSFQSWRSDLREALKTGERLSSWGKRRCDIRGCVLGDLTTGRTWAAYGALATARLHLQRALDLAASSDKSPATIWTFKESVSRAVVMQNIQAFLSRVLCWMGYPAQALGLSSAMVDQHEDEVVFVAGPMRLAQHLWVLSVLGEARDLVAPAEEMTEHCRHHNMPLFAATARIMRGYGVAHSGQPEAGQSDILSGLAAYAGMQAVREACYYRALLAETYRMTGETAKAISILTEALKETEHTGEKCYDAELHRGMGEAHRQCGDTQAAEQSFQQALTIARDQGARLWELNAATSYGRLLRDRGEPEQAHALLAPIYDWFSEGFEAAPLRRAKLLLDQLAAGEID
jgi:tetratricopeptide (TPR) repeat protein